MPGRFQIVWLILFALLAKGVFMAHAESTERSIPFKATLIASPLRSFNLTVGDSDQARFVEQLKAFALSRGLTAEVRQVGPDPHSVEIEMKDSTLTISLFNPFAPGVFDTAFYANNSASVPQDRQDRLEADLEKLAADVRGVAH
jgi:hypothetical protein